jgi:hypothetical protein
MREQKIILGKMRQSGPTRLLIYCQDYRCAHSVTIDAGQWPDDVRLSDLEPRFTCRRAATAARMSDCCLRVDKPPSGYPAHGLTRRTDFRVEGPDVPP